jgi:hypothetical protein
MIATDSPAPAASLPWRTRLRWALIIACFSIAVAGARALTEPTWPTDFDQFWHAARALMTGRNPYTVVGPGRELQWNWPMFYPLPAVLITLPFSLLPVAAGRVAFVAASSALLGFAITRDGLARLPTFLSAAYLIAIARTQWSPLLLASMWLPWLGAVLLAKPNVGAACFAALESKRAVVISIMSGTILLALSFIAMPTWPREFLHALESKTAVSPPVTRPGGFLLLLALLRWRLPEGRLLAALSLVPHTPSLYDLLPLFLIPRTVRETTILALCTHALFALIVVLGPFSTFDGYAESLGRWSPIIVFVPALAMLMRRPNRARAAIGEALPGHVAGTMLDLSPAPAPNAARGQLGRLDTALLALLGTSAAMLVWVSVATRR